MTNGWSTKKHYHLLKWPLLKEPFGLEHHEMGGMSDAMGIIDERNFILEPQEMRVCKRGTWGHITGMIYSYYVFGEPEWGRRDNIPRPMGVLSWLKRGQT